MADKALKDERTVFETPELDEVPAEELAVAVRWPDDPTGEVRGRRISKTIFKFVAKMTGQCEKRYNRGMKDGLLCSSHYGPLQFWHAMASRADEPTEETQRKMLAWAGFLYEVAAGDDKFLRRNYCEYWRGQQGREGKGELASVLAPEDDFPCTKEGPPWTISTLFSLTCRGARSSVTCDESLDPRDARLNALGALLHMVQDSYAQGHASRGSAELIPGTKRVKSKFECLPINQFYTYGAQNDKKHRQADAFPQPGQSCANASTGVHDPVLASANVLWFVQQKKGAKELTEYLEKRVFPLAEGRKSHAGAGELFAK
jgi:hypothetical protein